MRPAVVLLAATAEVPDGAATIAAHRLHANEPLWNLPDRARYA